jgi:hypothetical protein
MNERIRELAEQVYGTQATEQEIKFAELIVADVLNEVLQAMDDGMDVYDTVASKFRVEEQVNDSKKLHTCPYREEIHYDYESLCDCDEEQQHQCAMDI